MMDQNTGRQDTNSVQPDQDAANYMEGTSGRPADVNRANSSRGSDLDPTAMTTTNAESATSAMDTLGSDGNFGTPYDLDSSSSSQSTSSEALEGQHSGVGTGGFRRRLELVKQKAQEMAHIRGEQIMDRMHHLKDDAKIRSERVDKTIRSNTYWFVLGSFGIGMILGRLFKGKMVSSDSETKVQSPVKSRKVG